MPTVDELLEQIEGGETYSENVLYCIIDAETREISIPPEYQIFGVESDEKQSVSGFSVQRSWGIA